MAHISPKLYARALYDVLATCEGSAVDRVIEEFAKRLIRRNQMKHVDQIIAAFEAYADKKDGKVHAHITSAKELSDKMITAIKNAIGDVGSLTTSVDTTLIGGITVLVNDTLIDASVTGQLKKLEESIKS